MTRRWPGSRTKASSRSGGKIRRTGLLPGHEKPRACGPGLDNSNRPFRGLRQGLAALEISYRE